MGFNVSPVVLDLLVSKFDKTGGKSKAVEYDNFIEYGSTILVSIYLLAIETLAVLHIVNLLVLIHFSFPFLLMQVLSYC